VAEHLVRIRIKVAKGAIFEPDAIKTIQKDFRKRVHASTQLFAKTARTAGNKVVRPATRAYQRGWTADAYRQSTGWTAVRVYNTAAHFAAVEFGRRAGAPMPPLARIRQWCEIRGIDPRAAYPIARKIARDVIPARPVLFDESKTYIWLARRFTKLLRASVEDTGMRKKLTVKVLSG
jgi:hypothetical protein